MVVRCAWGTCNSDVRYPDRLVGIKFYRFPNPKHHLEKCKRWIKACGRPHEQLNLTRLNKHKAICSKHFHNGIGPTKEYPDPMNADGSRMTPVRSLPVKRGSSINKARKVLIDQSKQHSEEMDVSYDENIIPGPVGVEHEGNCVETQTDGSYTSVEVQTAGMWIEPVDVLSLAAENESLKTRVNSLEAENTNLKKIVREKEESIQKQEERMKKTKTLSVRVVQMKESKLKNLFQFYTGITYIRFLGLLAFLVPDSQMLKYKGNRRDLKTISNDNGLFLTLCRLRHAFELKDIAARFGLTLQSAGDVFNTWLDLMYFKLGQLSIWPHRDAIINNMPAAYKKDFPTSLIIIDGTEIKTQVPKAMRLQSQLYSDYKSSTTLKCLIGCDPSGNLMFVSELFTGSISDKAITQQSGFYDTLQTMKDYGYVIDGDAIMVDKGFNIEKELNELGLKVNIPPFASNGCQMTVSETYLTQKIAKHRVHIERLIRKVKTYKLVSNCVPTSLFHAVNKIWSVCCHLTLFQDVFVKDKVV